MFILIEDEKPETFPVGGQYIAFKMGDAVYPGYYEGDRKAMPLTPPNGNAPTVFIKEWMPIRIWA